jgi:hypothetical protein
VLVEVSHRAALASGSGLASTRQVDAARHRTVRWTLGTMIAFIGVVTALATALAQIG